MKEIYKEVVPVKFKSVEDFKRRIYRLWQNQQEHEIYHFEFPDEEIEKECNELFKHFDIVKKVEG